MSRKGIGFSIRGGLLVLGIILVAIQHASAQIALRGTPTSATATGTTLTIARPAGVMPGDLLVVNIATTGTASNASLTGWTSYRNASMTTSPRRRASVLYRVAGASEPASYAFSTGSGTVASSGAIVAFSGVNTTTPFDVSAPSIRLATSGTVTASSLTTVNANVAILFLGQAVGSAGGNSIDWNDATWRSSSAPGAMTELFDVQETTNRVSVGGAWATRSTAGSTGNGTVTISTSVRNGGVLLALRPLILDQAPPQVSSTTPLTGATGVAISTLVTAVFNEALSAASVTGTNVTLRAGTTAVPSTVTYNSTNRSVVLTPSSALAAGTTYTVTLRGGSGGITDAAGNPLAADYVWSFTTAAAADLTAPQVSSTTPLTGATGVATGTLVTAVFNEALSAASVTGTNVTLRAGTTSVPSTVTYNSTNQSVVLTPSSALAAGTTYTVTLRGGSGGIADVAGNPLAADYVWSFTTAAAADLTAPQVSSTAPLTGATGVATGTLVTAVFNEGLSAASVTAANVLLRAGSTDVAASVVYNSAAQSVVLTPSSALAAGTTYTVTLRGGSGGITDAAGNPLAADYVWSFTTAAAAPAGNITVFTTAQQAQAATSGAGNDGSAIQLGMKFRSTVSGLVRGIRFYKNVQNTGTHIGQLWSSTGTLLGQATFVNESSSGWQEVLFSSPVQIDPNLTYVVSYHSASGGYSFSNGYFSSATVANGPLRALTDGEDGGNGVYRYTSSPAFPSSSYQGSNYWVDVVFESGGSAGPDVTAPQVSSTTPLTGATGVFTGSLVTAVFNEALAPASVTTTNAVLRAGATVVPSSVVYNSAAQSVVLTPSSALSAGTTYTVTLRGGSGGITDAAGNPLAADYVWSFTTASATVPSGTMLTVFTSAQQSQAASSSFNNDGSGLQLGMKFRSTVSGLVRGIRFYKNVQNTGTHIGQLWSSTGTLLGQATFVNESSSGWQEVLFGSPVQVEANVTYVASYHSAGGGYSLSNGYFSSATVANGPLRALTDGEQGGNGVYRYTSSPAFPSSSYQGSNYWVDVVFESGGGVGNIDNTRPVSVITSPLNGSTLTQGTSVSVAGTASDESGIAQVEISVDGGVTWLPANGTTSWTFTWSPVTTGGFTIRSRARDFAGNTEIAGTSPGTNFVGVTVVAPSSDGGGTTQRFTVFTQAQQNQAPASQVKNDGSGLQLGMKFRSTVGGLVRGIRFYKNVQNTGTHIGQLWSSTGTLLGQATFVNESSSGWQEVLFGSPVQVEANVTYVASYHSAGGGYSLSNGYFSSATVANGPLRALTDGEQGGNGVYRYTSSPAFPSSSYQGSNYWVDVVFESGGSAGPDVTAPQVLSTSPVSNATGVGTGTLLTAVFNEGLSAASVTGTNVLLRAGGADVGASVVYNASNQSVVVTPSSALSAGTTYTVTLRGGSGGITDAAGNPLASDYVWSFTTLAPTGPLPDPNQGPGGPILVVTSGSNPYSRYYAEILRAEGLNAFRVVDVSGLDGVNLSEYDVVLLGELTLSGSQVSQLEGWVIGGGTLVAFRPSSNLLPLLGLSSFGGSLSDDYLRINTSAGPGAGLVGETIQFHGAADRYTVSDATVLATLYSDASTSTVHPAVTQRLLGSGRAVGFAYDLARSVVYTRQGNPAWAGQERDGNPVIRSNDMFFPDWVDLNKVAIPQADEQQRLLSNIIIQGNLSRRPLPRFWMLPRRLKAAVVMTGDDHANGGTTGHFVRHMGYGNNTEQGVRDWLAVRSTSYIYSTMRDVNLSVSQSEFYTAQGFEIGLHLNTNCQNYTESSLRSAFSDQLSVLSQRYPTIPRPSTHRIHCLAWSDWDSKPRVEYENGIRLNTDYYYWPESWVQNRPGMFTGSGFPMRFTDAGGSMVDNYQLTTQMTDESGMVFPGFVNTLLDNAVGPLGYYGVFCANMHTDASESDHPSVVGSEAIIASALARGVPVISARQMLRWLDGRNSSSFSGITWSSNRLLFTVSAGSGADNLNGMLPVRVSSNLVLVELRRGGVSVGYTTEVIKGVEYAFFDALSGSYEAVYQLSSSSVGNGSAPLMEDAASARGTGLKFFLLQNYPNPAQERTTVVYQLGTRSHVTLKLYDMQGRAVRTMVSGTMDAGMYKHVLDVRGLSPGMYYYQIQAGSYKDIKRMMIQ